MLIDLMMLCVSGYHGNLLAADADDDDDDGDGRIWFRR